MSTYTEAEARTKWCPFVRITPAAYDAGLVRKGWTWIKERVVFVHTNRETFSRRLEEITSSRQLNVRCIASECMAWRWRRDDETPLPGESIGEFKARRHGYCGLAGE